MNNDPQVASHAKKGKKGETYPREEIVAASRPVELMIWGLLSRRERWGISWRGWSLIVLVSIGAATFLFLNVYSFLAVTDRGETPYLVVEGWVHKYAILAAVKEFQNGRYERVLTTGGPVQGIGGYVNDYQTSASVGAELLVKEGLPASLVQMVPSRVMDRDRTYSAAVALRRWFREHNLSVHSLNIVTEDVHARRTRLLFRKAFGEQVRVGIIGVTNPDYDPKRWWRYSEGVKDVFSETMAFIYAVLFFHADPPDQARRSKSLASRFASIGFLSAETMA